MTEEEVPSTSSSSSSWRRLIMSEVFTVHMAMEYLHTKEDQLVQQLVCERLSLFPTSEVEFYMPQIICLCLTSPEFYIHLREYVVRTCSTSAHFSLLASWNVQAELDTETEFRRQKTIALLLHDINMATLELDTKENNDAAKTSDSVPPKSVTYASVVATSTMSPPQDDNVSPVSSSSSSPHQNNSNSKVVKQRCLEKEKNFIRSLVDIGDVLRQYKDKDTRRAHLFGELSKLNVALPARVYLPMNIIPEGGSGPQHAVFAYLQQQQQSAVNASKDNGEERLKVTTGDSSGSNQELQVARPLGQHHIVRIPPEEAVVLNSKDKAPYMLQIEVVECDDFYHNHLPRKHRIRRQQRREQRSHHRSHSDGFRVQMQSPNMLPRTHSDTNVSDDKDSAVMMMTTTTSTKTTTTTSHRCVGEQERISDMRIGSGLRVVQSCTHSRSHSRTFSDGSSVIELSPKDAGSRNIGDMVVSTTSQTTSQTITVDVSRGMPTTVSDSLLAAETFYETSYTPLSQPRVTSSAHKRNASTEGVVYTVSGRQSRSEWCDEDNMFNSDDRSVESLKVVSSGYIATKSETSSLLGAANMDDGGVVDVSTADFNSHIQRSVSTASDVIGSVEVTEMQENISNPEVIGKHQFEIEQDDRDGNMKEEGEGEAEEKEVEEKEGEKQSVTVTDIRKRLHVASSTPESKFRQSQSDPSAIKAKEDWKTKVSRIRSLSPYGHLPTWRLVPIIVKSGDDLRQEVLASQLLALFQWVWKLEGVPLWIRPLQVLVTSSNGGMIEVVGSAVSLHQTKRHSKDTLLNYFIQQFGPVGSPVFVEAQSNFVQSLAAYSLFTYFAQVKDRHNGNILIDSKGHLLHIDFGFFLSNSPGGNIGFETAPFKLLKDFVEVMDGKDSDVFARFKELLFKGFLAVRKHKNVFVTVLKIMAEGTDFPCFAKKKAVEDFSNRFCHGKPDSALRAHVDDLVKKSVGNTRTRLYDNFQYFTNGIL
eukprot:m.180864 g.180864  ORF g.180864 m.180864 type:complete len:984 (-) comp13579_c0_seq16:1290-4241(-)